MLKIYFKKMCFKLFLIRRYRKFEWSLSVSESAFQRMGAAIVKALTGP